MQFGHRFQLSIIALMLGQLVYASGKPADLFKVEPGPPPGFEAAVLKQKQTNMLDVYFDGKRVGSALATFTPKSLQFKSPAQLLKLIPEVSDPQRLKETFTAEFPTNEENLCPYDSNKDYCKSVYPAVAGVILDPVKYRVYLFINPKYLKESAQQKAEAFGPSTARHSFIAKNNFVASGTRNNQNYAWNNRSIWAYRNTRAQVDAAIQQNNDINGNSSYSQMTLQQANLGKLLDDTLYQGGQLNTLGGNDFITQQYFAGFGVRNYNTGLRQDSGFGSALPVFITVPSTVRVYRNGILIATQQFAAGRHFIDTSNFPSGSYDVSIQVTQNTTGQVSTTTRYYVKQTALPKKGKVDFALDVGFLQKNVSYNQNKFLSLPQYRDNPIIFYHTLYALKYNLGWENNYLVNFNDLYWSSNLSYYGDHFDISPGALLSNHSIYGASLDTSYRFKYASTGINLMKLWGRKETNLIEPGSDGVLSGSNQPLTANNLRLNLYANTNVGKGDLYGGVIYTQQANLKIEKDYNIQYSQPLYVNEHGAWEFSIGLTRAQQETTYMGTINYNFNENNGLSASANLGYTNNNGEGSNVGHGNLDADASVSKVTRWNLNRRLTVSGSAHRDDVSKYVSAYGEYVNNHLRAYLQVQQSVDSKNHNTSYSGEVDTDVTKADGHWALGYDESLQTGVVVNVLSPTPTTVEVYVDNTPDAIIPTGEPETIYMVPFKKHSVRIVPLGDHVFSYDKNAQEVSLYRGNFQYLTWTLAKQYILFTQILDEQGEPVKDALLKVKGEYNATDQLGYVQAEITSATHRMIFEKPDGQTCEVQIPKHIQVKDNFAQLKTLICQKS